MPRRQHRCTDSDDSDASFSPDDEVFDVDDNEDNIPSAATRVKDVDFAGIDDEDFDNVGDFDAEMDVEDQIQLFDGNLHPPEYWIQAVEQFREEDYTDGEYAEGTQKLIDGIEEHWFRYAARSRFSSLRLANGTYDQVLRCRETPSEFSTYLDRPTWHLLQLEAQPENQ